MPGSPKNWLDNDFCECYMPKALSDRIVSVHSGGGSLGATFITVSLIFCDFSVPIRFRTGSGRSALAGENRRGC